MLKINSDTYSKKLLNNIIERLLKKKAEDIKILDLRNVKNSVCDFFVICSGNSDRHVLSLADSVEEHIIKEKPLHRDGHNNSEWIILDYFQIFVHVFQKQFRDFYKIEELWGDADIIEC